MKPPGDGTARDPRGAPAELLTLAVLAVLWITIVTHTWARWGDVLVDAGGAVDRAARIASGAVLYRDVLSPYGPIGDWVLAGLFRLFGIHLMVVYALDLTLVATGSCLLWYVARRFLRIAECAVALTTFWMLLAFDPGLFNWVLPNTFAGVFGAFFALGTAAMLVAHLERPLPTRLAGASVAAALAGLSKVEFGVAAAGTVVVYCLALAPRGRRGRDLVWALGPAALVTAAVGIALLATVPWHDLVDDNLYRVRSFRTSTAAMSLRIPRWRATLVQGVLYSVIMPAEALLLAVALALARRRGPALLAGLVLASVVGWAVVEPGWLLKVLPLPVYGRLSPDRFAWTPAAWAIVGGVALVRWRRSATRSDGALVIVATLSVLLSLRWELRLLWPTYYGFLAPFLVVLLVRTPARWLTPATSSLAAVLVVAAMFGPALRPDLARYAAKSFALDYPRGYIRTARGIGAPLKATIDWLRAETAPTDTVAVLPEERFINFLAERRHPTRDPGVGPGWLATPGDVDGFIEELDAAATPVLVLSSRRYPGWGTGDLGAYNPRLMAELEARFVEVERFGPFRIYRRRGTAGRSNGPSPLLPAPVLLAHEHGLGAGATRFAVRGSVTGKSGEVMGRFADERRAGFGMSGGDRDTLLHRCVRSVGYDVADMISSGEYRQ